MNTTEKAAAKRQAPSSTMRKRRRTYRVKLPFVPSTIVERCTSSEEAYERYKQAHGIIASDHEPQIEPI